MPRYTIHIRNENDRWFRSEASKGDLINRLLNDYYISKGGAPNHTSIAVDLSGLAEGSNRPITVEEVCPGHPQLKMNCRRRGCKYGG